MHRPVFSPRRLIGAAAIASAAAMIPVAALAASSAPASTGTAVHRCFRSQLMTWLGIPGSATAGSFYYPLEFSNVSHSACTLYGFPGVSAIGSAGQQLGSPAGRDNAHRTQLVTLGPGQTAHALLQIAISGVYPPSACKPVTATALKVYAANDFESSDIQFSLPACAKSGPVYMHVQTTVGGVGVPLYSS